MVLDGAKGEKEKFDENRPDTRDYEVFDLNQDVGEGVEWTGQPYLTNILPGGEYQPSGLLYISNHENKEKLRARVKIRTEYSDKETIFREGSVGFDLIRSFKELAGENVTGINKYTITYKELQEYINSLNNITVLTIAHTSRDNQGNTIYWKTLEVTRVEE